MVKKKKLKKTNLKKQELSYKMREILKKLNLKLKPKMRKN